MPALPVPPVGGPLFLASSTCEGLAGWLGQHCLPGPVVMITAASDALPDREAIVAPLRSAVAAARRELRILDVGDDTAAGISAIGGPAASGAPGAAGARDAAGVLEQAGALLMPGGDPFRLLRRLRSSGAAAPIARRHADGLPVAGQSAGAMVCGPTLAPVTLTSPFAPAPGQDLEGLGLTATVVLPHHDRPGRAARHREAALLHAGTVDLVPLWDGEVRIESGREWRILQGGIVTRPARVADAGAVAAVFRAATTAAWRHFLGAEPLRRAPDDTHLWAERIEAGGSGFLVAEDAAGVLGFVLYRAAPDADLAAAAAGEVDLLYTLPRAWGLGIGRRLLERATFALLVHGFRQAVLWTEQRNHRALAVYRRNGWMLDGTVRERDYLGVPIRNLRHRLDLTTRAGGSDDLA